MNSESKRFISVVLTLTMILALFAPLSFAQAEAQIRGVLLDAEGMPAQGYQVGLRNDAGDLFLSSPTTADAQFVLAQLPADTYRLVAFDAKGVEFPVVSREVALKPGQVERVEIRLGSAEGMSPGRGRTAPAASKAGGWWGNLPLWGKIGIVAVGAFGVYTAVDDDDDEEPASPSQP